MQDSRNIAITKPIQIQVEGHIVQVAAGHGFTLCLNKDGNVFSSGLDNRGQLGREYSMDFKSISMPEKVMVVNAGYAHCAAVTTTRKLYMWGANSEGQLGIGDKVDRRVPTLIDSFGWRSSIVNVSCGQYHTGIV